MITSLTLSRQNQLKSNNHLCSGKAILIFSPENLRYLSQYSGEAAYGIVTSDANYLVTDYRFVEQAERECVGFTVICRDRKVQSLPQAFAEILTRHHITHCEFESHHINVQLWNDIANGNKNVAFTPLIHSVEKQRMIKDEFEVAQIKAAAAIADQALADLTGSIKEGVTERELALELEYRMLNAGSEGLSFPTIMLFAERSSLPHGMPSQKQLKHGDIILIDFGAVVNGYRSDMTRTFFFGSANTKQEEVYQTVHNAQLCAIETLRAGIDTNSVNQASLDVLNQSPYKEFSGEGLGHGVGLNLHEQPFIGMGANETLKAGNVITIEPGIYIPGWGGIRLEDDILITETGFEYLTHADKPFIIQ